MSMGKGERQRYRDHYTVVVTYGTLPNKDFATVPTWEEAVVLKEIAISKGYHDATIMRHWQFWDLRDGRNRGAS